MKAVEIRGKELFVTERSVPIAGPDEVLIRVRAAGVNRPDILQRLGHYPPPRGASDIPGLEVSGTDEKTGEEVCALLPGGGYAEYAVAHKSLCLPVPKGLDMTEAAALPECVFTVWNNLFTIGNLRPGETVLVHGGASGIGTTAIQMIRAFGGRAIVTAGSEDKCAACRKLGAGLAVNYKTGDFVEAVRDHTGGKGVDIVLDMVGGDYVPRNIECLAEGGRHVSIAFLNGAKSEIPIPAIMQKRLTLTGSTLRTQPVEEKAKLAAAIRANVWPKIMSGDIRPLIFRTFSLDEAMEAHKALDKGDHIGKIVLTLS